MKKLCALVLSVLLLFACAAARADEVPGTVLFTSEKLGYTMRIPEKYIAVNENWINNIRSSISDGSLYTAHGMTEEQAKAVVDSVDQVDFDHIDVFLGTGMSGTINIMALSFGFPGSELGTYKDLLDATMISQFVSIGVPEEDIRTWEIQNIGNYDWYRLDCTFLGQEVSQYFTADENGNGFLLSFHRIDPVEINMLVSTFTVR